jgi:actin-like ATPase involved in cell morphogenesis
VLSKKIGIDLGTSTVLMYVKRFGHPAGARRTV